MAFNFFGTFNLAQWEAFKAFTRIQRYDLTLRKKWLTKQIRSNGEFTTTYDDNKYPQKFTATGYAGKLLEAYRILGGVPERDMLLRTRNNPVYLTRDVPNVKDNSGSSIGGYGTIYSNGRRWSGNMRFDRDLGLRVDKIKEWELESIKLKRERLEFKIKAALDYTDQLQEEKARIDIVLKELDFWIDYVEVNMSSHSPPGDQRDYWNLGGGRVADLTDPRGDEQIAAEQQRTFTRDS